MTVDENWSELCADFKDAGREMPILTSESYADKEKPPEIAPVAAAATLIGRVRRHRRRRRLTTSTCNATLSELCANTHTHTHTHREKFPGHVDCLLVHKWTEIMHVCIRTAVADHGRRVWSARRRLATAVA
eukprot:SAG31_NODE_23340_length_506_cov_0.896806_1_plen_130_part_01